tara:strand:+ start:48 stop:1910 length:1863 start_codon:yes stop_codon:yes gene_type:complete
MARMKNNNLVTQFFSIISFDLIISLFSTYLAYSLRLESYHIPDIENIYTYVFCILIYFPVFLYFRIYDSILKYTNLYSISRLIIASIIYSIILFILITLVRNIDINIPRSIAIIQPIIFCFITIFIRILISLQSVSNNNAKNLPNLIIFGAGIAGSQLLDLISKNNTYKVVAFIDQNKLKHGRMISGIKIYSEEALSSIIKKEKVDNIIIAIPSLEISERRKIVSKLKQYNVETKILPDIKDLLNNNISLDDIKNLNIDDLLERQIEKDLNISDKLMKNKVVLITGGGGSIGSELCKQIILHEPSELIILDHSEFNLYRIKEDLEKIKNIKKINNSIRITAILLSINNFNGVENLFESMKPQIVFHTAAYKHVNLVEVNVNESVRNNFFGTLNIVELSHKYEIEQFMLISSDKAVRPSNIMGATKRLSELAVQAYGNDRGKKYKSTVFSIVRFGNVLASSGSVINKFQEQIQNREPLTVTHKEVTRYFMTIYEAVYLIIETFRMAKGGEVFLLDMGKPVKIIDIAEKMIHLSGLTIRNFENPYGEIDIKITGLRPGEKLYEELLIDDMSQPSSNKNIFYANEDYINLDELEKLKVQLQEAVNSFDTSKTINIFKKYVEGF